MNQEEAIRFLENRILKYDYEDKLTCSGSHDDCTNELCYVCGVRDCPNLEPMHYHKDGCPACFYFPDGDID